MRLLATWTGAGDWADAAALLNYLFGLNLQTRSHSATQQFDDMTRRASNRLSDDGASDSRRDAFTAHLKGLHAT